MDGKQRLVSRSGSVEEGILLRIEYLVAENCIVRDQDGPSYTDRSCAASNAGRDPLTHLDDLGRQCNGFMIGQCLMCFLLRLCQVVKRFPPDLPSVTWCASSS